MRVPYALYGIFCKMLKSLLLDIKYVYFQKYDYVTLYN